MWTQVTRPCQPFALPVVFTLGSFSLGASLGRGQRCKQTLNREILITRPSGEISLPLSDHAGLHVAHELLLRAQEAPWPAKPAPCYDRAGRDLVVPHSVQTNQACRPAKPGSAVHGRSARLLVDNLHKGLHDLPM